MYTVHTSKYTVSIKSGDGYCDDILNNAECLFDMGDCSSTSGSVTSSTSQPMPTVPFGCILPQGVPPQWLGRVFFVPKLTKLIYDNTIFQFRGQLLWWYFEQCWMLIWHGRLLLGLWTSNPSPTSVDNNCWTWCSGRMRYSWKYPNLLAWYILSRS